MGKLCRLLPPLVVFCCLALAHGAAPPAEFDGLVRQLGSDQFEVREAASRALLDRGEAVLPRLRTALRDDDVEVRLRARQIIRTIHARICVQVACLEEKAPVPCVAVSPDGRHALGAGRRARLWELSGGKVVRAFDEHAGPVHVVAFSPDGRLAVSAGGFRAVVWDVRSGAERRRLPWLGPLPPGMKLPDVGGLDRHAPEPVVFLDDRRLLVGSKVWDVDSGKELARFDASFDVVAVSPDRRRLLVGGRYERALCGHSSREEWLALARWCAPRLLDITTGKETGALVGPFNSPQALAFDANGTRAVSAHQYGEVLTWELNGRRVVRNFRLEARSVAFSPDGRRLLAGAAEGAVELWDVELGARLHAYRGHPGPVLAVAFTPDGRFGVTGGQDGTVRAWRLPE